MLIISHRGNLEGPDKITENNPEQIKKALDQVGQVEIDLWAEEKELEDELFLGHDEATYYIKSEFLYHPGLWVHCKNVYAFTYCWDLAKRLKNLKFFSHAQDDFALVVADGNIATYAWTYPGKNLLHQSFHLPIDPPAIAVLPETVRTPRAAREPHGICTDFPLRYMKEYNINDRINSRIV